MTKGEFYDKAVEMYQKTGQGLPYRLMTKYKDLADELIEDGLMRLYHDRYNTLPDDEWLCLTNVICPEETFVEKDSTILHNLRYYLGVKEEGIFAQIPESDKFKEQYEVWLKENLTELEKIPHLPKSHELGIKSKTTEEKYSDVIEKYKSSNHYKINKSVGWIDINCDDQLRVYKKLISLMEEDGHKDLDKTIEERDLMVNLKKLLKNYDSSALIQDCF